MSDDGKRKFDQGDYLDVAHRVAEFREKYPDGSLRPVDPAQPFRVEEIGGKTFIVYAAAAYRRPDDNLPGIGLAWEPFPGLTPFTRNSELQNAETSAWGRAIMASLAADARKGIASAEEVRNRAHEPDEPSRPAPTPFSRPGAVSAPPGGNGSPRPAVEAERQSNAGGAPGGLALAPIPTCDYCGGPGVPNPLHAKNANAPEFRCAGNCEDPSKTGGKPWPHGYSRATAAQIKSASIQIDRLVAEAQMRFKLDPDEAMAQIRDFLVNVVGVPGTRKAWSKAHAGKALDVFQAFEQGHRDAGEIFTPPAGPDSDIPF